MTRFEPRTILLVVAMENELSRLLVVGWRIVCSGVGKVSAAITLPVAANNWLQQFELGARLFPEEVLTNYSHFR